MTEKQEVVNDTEAEPTPTELYNKSQLFFNRLTEPLRAAGSGGTAFTPPSLEKTQLISAALDELSPPEGMAYYVNELPEGDLDVGESYIRFLIADTVQADVVQWALNYQGVPMGGVVNLHMPEDWSELPAEHICGLMAEILDYMRGTINHLNAAEVAKAAEEMKH